MATGDNRPIENLSTNQRSLKIMEVCGTHTSVILKNGIQGLLPKGVKLVSGPGCPVCVTESAYIDALISFAQEKNQQVLCYGDLFKIRGTTQSFLEARAAGGRFALIYSPLDAVRMAKNKPNTQFALAAVGFETTIPLYALLMETILLEKIENLKIAFSLKSMLPALSFIGENEAIDGFICPGHVSVIIGSDAYKPLCARYQKPFVVAGFSPESIFAAVDEIITQTASGNFQVKNLYQQVVRSGGNPQALTLIEKYFTICDGDWRGIGSINASAFTLKEEYRAYQLVTGTSPEALPAGCRCTDVLLGRITPGECALFGKSCRAEHPVGACMTSQEGACAVWYNTVGAYGWDS